MDEIFTTTKKVLLRFLLYVYEYDPHKGREIEEGGQSANGMIKEIQIMSVLGT